MKRILTVSTLAVLILLMFILSACTQTIVEPSDNQSGEKTKKFIKDKDGFEIKDQGAEEEQETEEQEAEDETEEQETTTEEQTKTTEEQAEVTQFIDGTPVNNGLLNTNIS